MTASTMTGAALRLDGLVKSYGANSVVDGVSLDIAPGEFVTLLGPSGSGKTTTLNMIAGFTDVTDGEITLDDRPIARLRPHKRNIGVVFQHYALFPHMTVGANVAFPLRQRRMSRREIRDQVQDALELVRLGGLVDRYPRQLSGGQQQRVALARALVFHPRLLLMDEPLGALDKKLRESLQREIRRIHQEIGITFVYVTHDQDEALALSDRIAVFNAGRIEQVGDAQTLYERPATSFVADFIGESNFLRGTYHLRHPGSACLAVGELTLPAPADPRFTDGMRALLVLRPEQVRIDLTHSGAASPIGKAEVTEIQHLGGTRRVELGLGDGLVLVAREQAGAWGPLSSGDTVTVDYDLQSAVLFPDDDVGPPR